MGLGATTRRLRRGGALIRHCCAAERREQWHPNEGAPRMGQTTITLAASSSCDDPVTRFGRPVLELWPRFGTKPELRAITLEMLEANMRTSAGARELAHGG